jgi:hypothetical protein
MARVEQMQFAVRQPFVKILGVDGRHSPAEASRRSCSRAHESLVSCDTGLGVAPVAGFASNIPLLIVVRGRLPKWRTSTLAHEGQRWFAFKRVE